MCDELHNLSPFAHAVPSRGYRISKPSKSNVKEFICGRSVPSGTLSVKGPTKNKLYRTIMVSSHPSEPMVNQR